MMTFTHGPGTTRPPTVPPPEEPSADCFLGAIVDGQTYRNMLYALIALPIGILVFTLVVAGSVVSVVAAVTIIGLPMLATTSLLLERVLDGERRLANRLLGTCISAPPRLPQAAGWRRTVNGARTCATYRRGVFFLLLRLPIGILSFTSTVLVLSFVVSILAFPLIRVSGELFGWSMKPQVFGSEINDGLAWLLTIVLVPVIVVAGVHLINFGAWLLSGLARTLLSDPAIAPRDDPEAAVISSIFSANADYRTEVDVEIGAVDGVSQPSHGRQTTAAR